MTLRVEIFSRGSILFFFTWLVCRLGCMTGSFFRAREPDPRPKPKPRPSTRPKFIDGAEESDATVRGKWKAVVFAQNRGWFRRLAEEHWLYMWAGLRLWATSWRWAMLFSQYCESPCCVRHEPVLPSHGKERLWLWFRTNGSHHRRRSKYVHCLIFMLNLI